jgi:hypothetical protein
VSDERDIERRDKLEAIWQRLTETLIAPEGRDGRESRSARDSRMAAERQVLQEIETELRHVAPEILAECGRSEGSPPGSLGPHAHVPGLEDLLEAVGRVLGPPYDESERPG